MTFQRGRLPDDARLADLFNHRLRRLSELLEVHLSKRRQLVVSADDDGDAVNVDAVGRAEILVFHQTGGERHDGREGQACPPCPIAALWIADEHVHARKHHRDIRYRRERHDQQAVRLHQFDRRTQQHGAGDHYERDCRMNPLVFRAFNSAPDFSHFFCKFIAGHVELRRAVPSHRDLFASLRSFRPPDRATSCSRRP